MDHESAIMNCYYYYNYYKTETPNFADGRWLQGALAASFINTQVLLLYPQAFCKYIGLVAICTGLVAICSFPSMRVEASDR